jgi:hypothetical protein
VLIYRVPSEPTRLRAAVWRRLKRLGAIYLQNSTVALPAGPSAERAFRRLRHEILNMSGSAVLMSCQVLVGDSDVRAAFVAARDDEYEQIVDECNSVIANIGEEATNKRFDFAFLKEKELAAQGLQRWLTGVRERDVFDAGGRIAAEGALARCEAALEEYAAAVYSADSVSDASS